MTDQRAPSAPSRIGTGWPLTSLMLGAPWIGVRKRWPNVLHAVRDEDLPIATWPRGTARSACGLAGVRLEWSNGGPVPWPPRLRWMPDGWSRCADCHDATGRKRPRSEFRPKVTANA